MREHAALPDRCIKCNSEAVGKPLQVRVQWQDPNFRKELSELRWIPYLRIIWMVSNSIEQRRHRHSAKIRIPLCKRHRSMRHWGVMGAAMLTAPAVGLGLVAWRMERPSLFVVSGAMVFAALLLANFWPSVVTAVRIDHGLVTLHGCGQAFLASLPVGKAPPAPSTVTSSGLAAATLRLSQRRR
jgi:hypothetical protein